MREALRSTSPVGLQDPLWDWSKLIPPPTPCFAHQKAAEFSPNQGCAQTSGFLPHSRQASVTHVPQQRGDNSSSRNAGNDPTFTEQ